jgi:hypothetical protein
MFHHSCEINYFFKDLIHIFIKLCRESFPNLFSNLSSPIFSNLLLIVTPNLHQSFLEWKTLVSKFTQTVFQGNSARHVNDVSSRDSTWCHHMLVSSWPFKWHGVIFCPEKVKKWGGTVVLGSLVFRQPFCWSRVDLFGLVTSRRCTLHVQGLDTSRRYHLPGTRTSLWLSVGKFLPSPIQSVVPIRSERFFFSPIHHIRICSGDYIISEFGPQVF